MIVHNLSELLQLQVELSRKIRVKKSTLSATPKWHIHEGKLQHIPPAYFEVLAVQTSKGNSLMLHQPEQAIVLLLVAKNQGERYFLLSIRAEPGLLKGVVFTSTIQSTPSNLQQVHEGAATPYVEYLEPSTNKVFETFEFDYTAFYLSKSKRFVVVELEEIFEPEENYVWVSEELMHSCLLVDDLLGTDLRALFAHFCLVGSVLQSQMPRTASDVEAKPIPFEQHPHLQNTDTGIRDVTTTQGASVEYFETSTSIRETSNWIQPLVILQTDGVAGLFWRKRNGQIEYALKKLTQVGVAPHNLWFPSFIQLPGEPTLFQIPSAARRVRANLEGGRFFQVSYLLFLCELHSSDGHLEGEIQYEWHSLDSIREILTTPLSTSVELRMVLSLALEEHLLQEVSK